MKTAINVEDQTKNTVPHIDALSAAIIAILDTEADRETKCAALEVLKEGSHLSLTIKDCNFTSGAGAELS